MYYLDPMLAIQNPMDVKDAVRFGLKYGGSPQVLKEVYKIEAKLVKGKTSYSEALRLIVDEISPFIDILRFPGLTDKSEDKLKSLVVLNEEIAQSDYNSLSSFAKQLYVDGSEVFSDRFPDNSIYADMIVPSAGKFGEITTMATSERTVAVRGAKSRIPAGYRGVLVKLLDGSLLELYTTSNIASSTINSMLSELVKMEPVVTKSFILSYALTDDLGRPAYKIDTIISTLQGINSLSTTGRQEVIEFGSQSDIIQSDTSVLKFSAGDPAQLFLDSSNAKFANEKASQLKDKYKNNSTLSLLLEELTKPFDTTSLGGTASDYLHPAIVEVVIDDYAANRDRTVDLRNKLDMLIQAASKMKLTGVTTTLYLLIKENYSKMRVWVASAILDAF